MGTPSSGDAEFSGYLRELRGGLLHHLEELVVWLLRDRLEDEVGANHRTADCVKDRCEALLRHVVLDSLVRSIGESLEKVTWKKSSSLWWARAEP